MLGCAHLYMHACTMMYVQCDMHVCTALYVQPFMYAQLCICRYCIDITRVGLRLLLVANDKIACICAGNRLLHVERAASQRCASRRTTTTTTTTTELVKLAARRGGTTTQQQHCNSRALSHVCLPRSLFSPLLLLLLQLLLLQRLLRARRKVYFPTAALMDENG